jgi:hypothetical protein
MDPCKRRQTWEILLKYKAGRTTLLTTHFMDEVMAHHYGDYNLGPWLSSVFYHHGCYRLTCSASALPFLLKDGFGLNLESWDWLHLSFIDVIECC